MPADHAAQRMRGADLVVAVAEHEQRAGAFDAPAEKLDEVQRRVVGPVQVLDHHQCRRVGGAQLGQHRLEQRRPRPVQPCAEARTALSRHVEQRRQRMRRFECVAGAPPDGRAGVAGRQRPQHAGLADACFAGHQRDAAVPRRVAQQRGQFLQHRLSFDQTVHGAAGAAGVGPTAPACPARRRARARG
jgi:hypothetical protein